MMRLMHRYSLVLALILSTLATTTQAAAPPDREKLRKTMKAGNFKDALAGYQQLCFDAKTEKEKVPEDLRQAVQCLSRLGRQPEIDELLEKTVEVHNKNWRLLNQAATQYLQINHWGYMVAGKFERGGRRGGGRVVHASDRDRTRALQLIQLAMPLADKDDNPKAAAVMYINLTNVLLNYRGFTESWRLQYLTDLSALPDYENGWGYGSRMTGAPVDEKGTPIYHKSVKRWKDATTDGERWRWALNHAAELDAGRRDYARWQFAEFCANQFSSKTMANIWPRPFFPMPRNGDNKDDTGTYALHTLGESETIARLATGIKRFKLPDEYNFIKLYKSLVDGGYKHSANSRLANIYLNRRQYPQAAEYFRTLVATNRNNANYKRQLQQIVANWGQLEPTNSQPAMTGATLNYRFRNGKKVAFTAHEIKTEVLLADVKAYLKSSPQRPDSRKMNVNNLGYRLVYDNQQKYVGNEIAAWKLDLKPREKHFDRRITVSTPLQKPGAYLVKAQMEGGNTSNIVVWVADTAIVRKQMSGKTLYYVADAVTGKPIAKANLEFFGYQRKRVAGNRYRILTTNFSEHTNDSGQVTPDPRDLKTGFQWLITARTKAGRQAYLGFSNIWYNRYHDEEYKTTRIFTITDRPVYRPKQTVNFKFWVRHAQYDKADVSQFAKASCGVDIFNPKNEKVYSQTLIADEYGGVEGKLELPTDAALGVYRIAIRAKRGFLARAIQGGHTFRVEEYKKPEYEVTIDAPTKPVMLGETVNATVTAKYYFGSPVTNATVKVKVMRTSYSQNWFPVATWDWCFGEGYWWFGYDYPWYPGWSKWVGCMRPTPWWWYQAPQPPEVVIEREVEIGADGKIVVPIDTALAKELHGDTDHRYTIQAEVRDESRRTIVGQGQVLVARKPFKVFSWVNRGYFRVGERIEANFNAQTLDRRPVQGKGKVTLYRITYDPKRKPIETPVADWDLDTNDEGRASQVIQASRAGQYRISYSLTDESKHTIEGGYIFTIVGAGFDGANYRFSNLELIPDKREYKPGEPVKLQINTNRTGATVLLFVRPANGVYLPPRVIPMSGKSTVAEIRVVKRDMPNFFVEALTVFDGKVHAETKEIIVPPEKRVLNVDVHPSSKTYKPGEESKVKIRLTDSTGENFVGSTVVAIYDKSVEYISGGSNTGDIRKFFWSWRRRHNPNHYTSLSRPTRETLAKTKIAMGHLGLFGASVASELDALQQQLSGGGLGVRRGQMAPGGMNGMAGGFGGGGGEGMEMAMMSVQENAVPASRMLAKGQAGVADASKQDAGGGGGGGGAALVQPTVRKNFADTALWVGALTTDKTGQAEVSLKMPENLTTWKVKVWGMGHGTNVGSGEAEVITRKNLILRLQSPRFVVERDELFLTANVHNYLDEAKDVTVELYTSDEIKTIDPPKVTVKVAAGGEKRVDWRVKVMREGQATIRMSALTDVESDATEVKIPVKVHGILKTEAWAGTVRPDKEKALVQFRVPEERRVEQSRLEIRYSPSLAAAMVDALPYLADYPHGCTEQTLNRFLPAVITQRVLIKMNIDLEAVREKRTNLNAQEIGNDKERAKQWKRFKVNPVFDRKQLDLMVKEGLKRLTNMQNADGGWGWFSGTREYSWPHTTAVVVHGLQIAKENDVPLVPGVLEKGIAWIKRYQAAEVRKLKNAKTKTKPYKNRASNIDAFVYMILVDADIDNTDMRDYLYRDRVELAVYSKAMLGLALHKKGQNEKRDMIIRNIEQFLVQDAENETAYLKLPADNYWWYWYGSEIEANAYYLKLLAAVKPKEIQASRLVKYLLNNRKHATYWRSTRDTAVCVEAFADYLRASGEDKPDMVVEIWMDGKKQKEVKITSDNMFDYDNKLVLEGAAVTNGSHTLEVRRQGKGPVYFNAYLTNFTLEDHITRAGLEVKVQRDFYKLVPVDKRVAAPGSRGQVTNKKVEKYQRIPLKNLAALKSGDLVEVELVIDSKNDYEYLLFEDHKAAGFEPVDLRSGYTYTGLRAYMELRDDRVSFFVRRLARGRHSVSYRLRAETPGRFSALPTFAHAMYAPELRGNSDEIKLKIED